MVRSSRTHPNYRLLSIDQMILSLPRMRVCRGCDREKRRLVYEAESGSVSQDFKIENFDKECTFYSSNSLASFWSFVEFINSIVLITDKELDIIEMAVYGDVIRPGNQCRCRTVAEMLGQYKSKDQMSPCKLPYDTGEVKSPKAPSM